MKQLWNGWLLSYLLSKPARLFSQHHWNWDQTCGLAFITSALELGQIFITASSFIADACVALLFSLLALVKPTGVVASRLTCRLAGSSIREDLGRKAVYAVCHCNIVGRHWEADDYCEHIAFVKEECALKWIGKSFRRIQPRVTLCRCRRLRK